MKHVLIRKAIAGMPEQAITTGTQSEMQEAADKMNARTPGVYRVEPAAPRTTKTKATRDAALGYVEAAQRLLYQAASVSCDLQGWSDQWDAIGKHADATKALWHKLNDAPLPIGHDGEKTDS